jgi:lipopolysaccharide export system permease protein
VLLDRYLVREIAQSFVAVALVLTGVFLAWSLTRFLTDAAGGLLKAAEVARLTMFKSVIALEVLLPLALYFGLIIGCGRLNLHGELTAMRAAGIGRRHLQRVLLLPALLLAVAIGALSVSVRPWAYNAMFELKAQADAASELDRVKPKRFYLYDDDRRAVYVEGIAGNGRRLTGVFIRERRDGDLQIITAPGGRLLPYVTPNRHRLELDDATLYRSVDDAGDFYGIFGSLTLSLRAARTVLHEYRTKAASTAELLAATAAVDRAELQWRLSTPLSTVLLALTALALTETRPRQSRFSRLPQALLLYAVYYNLLALGRTWVEQDAIAHIWWVPGLLAVVLAWLVRPGRALTQA